MRNKLRTRARRILYLTKFDRFSKAEFMEQKNNNIKVPMTPKERFNILFLHYRHFNLFKQYKITLTHFNINL